MNKIILIGRITKDLELKYTNNDKAVCNFSIAVNRFGTKETDFFDIVVWNKQAENLVKYQTKGSKVGVVGSLTTRKYETKDGQQRTAYEIMAQEIEFLDSKATKEEPKEEAKTSFTTNELMKDAYKEFGNVVEEDDIAF